jgi:hypothetical protein
VFASVTRVQSGHVGVLTLFGRVTGEVLPEGWEKIIFDTDIGNDIDDAFAVALAISSPDVDILGFTTAWWATQLRARIADRIQNFGNVPSASNRLLTDPIAEMTS